LTQAPQDGARECCDNRCDDGFQFFDREVEIGLEGICHGRSPFCLLEVPSPTNAGATDKTSKDNLRIVSCAEIGGLAGCWFQIDGILSADVSPLGFEISDIGFELLESFVFEISDFPIPDESF